MAVDVHHAESNALQSQVADLRQKIGNLEGVIHASSEARDIINRELIELKIQLSDSAQVVASSAIERDLLLIKLHGYELEATKQVTILNLTPMCFLSNYRFYENHSKFICAIYKRATFDCRGEQKHAPNVIKVNNCR